MSSANGPTGSNATIHGSVARGFEPVAEAFERNFREHGEVGAAFAAVCDGNPVVDLWGGVSDAGSQRPWEKETLQMIWSGTKGLVGVCLLLLIERGLLDLNTPVAHYWPEFANAGKDKVLVSHVASHTAGVPGVRRPVAEMDLLDGRGMARRVANEEPLWEPGTDWYYHAHTFGWICGELVERIDGRSIGRFFADEIASPLGLEIWIGLPEELERRVSTMRVWSQWDVEAQRTAREADSVQTIRWVGPALYPDEALPWNTRAYHAAEIPSANAIGTSRSIARLYGWLARGGDLDGIRLLSKETLEQGCRQLVAWQDETTGVRASYGVGFALQTADHPFGPVCHAFGHGGLGGSIHGAWSDEEVGFSYSMNDLRDDPSDPRAKALLTALRESCDSLAS